MAKEEDLDEMLESAVRETEGDLLKQVFSDEKSEKMLAETEAEAEPPHEEKETEQPRDEKGRFATTKPEEKPPAEEPAKPEGEAEAEAANVPSWRLREVAEARRAAEAKAEAEGKRNAQLEAQLRMLNDRINELHRPPQQQQEIDPLIDPQGFIRRIEENHQRQRYEDNLNHNLALSRVKHGEVFDKAYSALLTEINGGNYQLRNHIIGQNDPGEALVNWHKNQQTLKEVGNDPAAYRNKILEDALKDPEFQAKVIEAARQGAVSSGSRGFTQLPPSLTRASGSATSQSSEDLPDNDDRALFEAAFAPPQARGRGG